MVMAVYKREHLDGSNNIHDISLLLLLLLLLLSSLLSLLLLLFMHVDSIDDRQHISMIYPH